MNNWILVSSSALLVTLVLLLALRILYLYRGSMASPSLSAAPSSRQHYTTQRSENAPSKVDSHSAQGAQEYSRVDWMSKAQIFAGIQLLDAKRKGLVLADDNKPGCRQLAAMYMIGAAKGIILNMQGNDRDARDVAAFLMTHNLHFDRLDIEEALNAVTRDESTLNSYRCGLEGAETWLARRFVPDSISLYEAVSSNAFI